MSQTTGGIDEIIAGEPSFVGDQQFAVGFSLLLNPLQHRRHTYFGAGPNRFVCKVSIKLEAMSCEGIQGKVVGFTGRKEDPHVVQAMKAEAFGKVKVSLQPIVVLEMFERPDDLAPIGNAFTALCRISDDSTSFQNQHIKPFLCQALGCCTACRTRTDDDDLTVFNFANGHESTSSMPVFDDVCDE